MIILSKEQVLQLHTSLIETTGGEGGIRDEGRNVAEVTKRTCQPEK